MTGHDIGDNARNAGVDARGAVHVLEGEAGPEKMRASSYGSGPHDVRIVTEGLRLSRRFESRRFLFIGAPKAVSSRVENLDTLGGGGLDRETTVLRLRGAGAGDGEGTMRRALSVYEKRSEDHERPFREIKDEADGIHAGEPPRRFRGILTGSPRAPGAESEEGAP